MIAETVHHRLDFFGAALALLNDRDIHLFRVAVFEINLLQQLIERPSFVFCPSRHLGQNAAGRYGILVTHKVLTEESVTFFSTANILFLAFVSAHHLGNPLETGINIVHLDAPALRDGANRLGRNNRFDNVFPAA